MPWGPGLLDLGTDLGTDWSMLPSPCTPGTGGKVCWGQGKEEGGVRCALTGPRKERDTARSDRLHLGTRKHSLICQVI